MANIPAFIDHKRHPEKITYPDPRLEEILKPSYGILTFQDDVLLTTIIIAGYDWLMADKFRKAMGKKIPAEMKKQEETFIEGAMKNGLTRQKSEELFQLIAPFAGYGFNKAHASCYATIAYRTAYLKAHYPVEFMTALLTAENRGSTGPTKGEKISQALAECKRLKVEVLPPSVNYSISDFSIEDETKIRFGLAAIKNVGSAAIFAILEARRDGSFQSLFDFASRVDLSKVNKKTFESLIKAGAMDAFGKRASFLSSFQAITDKISKEQKQAAKNQGNLFGEDTITINTKADFMIDINIQDFSDREKLMFERELLGFFLTDHPMNQELNYLVGRTSHQIQELEEEREGRPILVGGLISQIKKIYTKKGNKEMAFVTLEDQFGFSLECVVFPKTFDEVRDMLLKDSVVVMSGKLDFKDEQPVLLVDKVKKVGN